MILFLCRWDQRKRFSKNATKKTQNSIAKRNPQVPKNAKATQRATESYRLHQTPTKMIETQRKTITRTIQISKKWCDISDWFDFSFQAEIICSITSRQIKQIWKNNRLKHFWLRFCYFVFIERNKCDNIQFVYVKENDQWLFSEKTKVQQNGFLALNLMACVALFSNIIFHWISWRMAACKCWPYLIDFICFCLSM